VLGILGLIAAVGLWLLKRWSVWPTCVVSVNREKVRSRDGDRRFFYSRHRSRAVGGATSVPDHTPAQAHHRRRGGLELHRQRRGRGSAPYLAGRGDDRRSWLHAHPGLRGELPGHRAELRVRLHRGRASRRAGWRPGCRRRAGRARARPFLRGARGAVLRAPPSGAGEDPHPRQHRVAAAEVAVAGSRGRGSSGSGRSLGHSPVCRACRRRIRPSGATTSTGSYRA
jgi:hypothetical protein